VAYLLLTLLLCGAVWPQDNLYVQIGNKVAKASDDLFKDFQWAPDSNYIYALSKDAKYISRINVVTFFKKNILHAGDGEFLYCSISPSGNYLAVLTASPKMQSTVKNINGTIAVNREIRKYNTNLFDLKNNRYFYSREYKGWKKRVLITSDNPNDEEEPISTSLPFVWHIKSDKLAFLEIGKFRELINGNYAMENIISVCDLNYDIFHVDSYPIGFMSLNYYAAYWDDTVFNVMYDRNIVVKLTNNFKEYSIDFENLVFTKFAKQMSPDKDKFAWIE
jgi:hypothetical protein